MVQHRLDRREMPRACNTGLELDGFAAAQAEHVTRKSRRHLPDEVGQRLRFMEPER